MNATEFINTEVPITSRLHFPKAMQSAYSAVTSLLKENRWLKECPSVVVGHLRAWAAEFAMAQLVESGNWPARKLEWARYPTGSGRYLRIFTDGAVVTVSQLEYPWQQPRKATFRENAKFNNQTFLFPEMNPEPVADQPHLIIGHGYQTLNFAQIGMPHPEHPTTWLGKTKNLFDELHDISSSLAPAEGMDAQPEPTIKEDLLKKLSEYGS